MDTRTAGHYLFRLLADLRISVGEQFAGLDQLRAGGNGSDFHLERQPDQSLDPTLRLQYNGVPNGLRTARAKFV